MTDRLTVDTINADQLNRLYDRLDGYEAAERYRKAATEATRPASPAVVVARTGAAVRREIAAGVQRCDEAADMVRKAGVLRSHIADALLDHLSRTADVRQNTEGELAFMPVVTDDERMRLADVVLLAVLPHGKFLGDQLRHSGALIERVIALHERWVADGAPPLGVPIARWWDRRLVELHEAINPPADQPKEK